MKQFTPIALPILGALLAYALGLTLALGAHPWWADKIILLGLGLGLLLSVLLWSLRLSKAVRLVILTVLSLGAYATAYTGKSRFAASYAEDAVAGQMWYFGWIATCTFVLALLAATAWPDRTQR